MSQQQPPVTEANIRNELEYWLSKVPPEKLLNLVADKFHERNARHREPNGTRRDTWENMSQVLKGLAALAGTVWLE